MIAALRDLGPSNVRFGSFTTDAVEATRACLSAVARKRTISESSRYVRFVPQADICGAANEALFDHLVGAAEQQQRHSYAEFPGRHLIDAQVNFRDLLHR
jgi:hypothetical protein